MTTTCNNIILSQPSEGSVLNHEIPADVSARLNFGPDDISGLRIGDAGQLVISFVDGGQLNITNFDDVVDNGNLLYLEDGTLIDPSILTGALKSPQDFNNIETAAGAAINADAIRIAQPAANTTQEISMQNGQKYVCDFDPANAATVELKDGQMILTFADGSQVVINNYAQAMAGNLPAELTVEDGTVVDTEALLTEVTQVEAIEEILEFAEAEAPTEVEETVVAQQEAPVENIAEQLNAIETAAGEDLAQTLAQIEPAAGEVGGASNSGYGFNSTATDVPLNSPDAIGPLGATQLGYSAPEFQQQQYIPLNSVPTTGGSRVDLDETNLSGGDLVGTGRVDVNFGGDAVGSIQPNGTFTATCNVAGDAVATGGFQLSSGGVDVDVTATANGYEGYAGNVLVFTLEVNPTTGAYTYTQVEPFDHSDTTDDNEAICLDFGIIARDADGDSITTNIRVNVLDDAPVVTSQVAGQVDETDFDGAAGGNVATGTFFADAGEDESATYTGNDDFAFMGSVDNGALTSNGVPVVVTYDAATNTYTGVAGTVTVFTMVIDPVTADYTYTQLAPLDHADENDANDVIVLKFGVDVTDFDGDTASGQITINVLDDAPVTGDDTNTIDEDNLSAGNPIVVNDNVSVDFGEDGEGSLEPSGTFTFAGSVDKGTVLSSGGENITVTATDDGYVGKLADGTVIFELEITDPSTGAYTFTQYGPLDHADDNDANDTIELNFGTLITDFDGDSEPGNIQIIIQDSAPVFQTEGPKPDSGEETVDESDDGTLSESGQLNADFGGDADGTYVADGISSSTVALTSCGEAVTISFDAATNTYTGATATETIFTLTIDAETGEYTYEQIGSLDHPDATDPDDVITINFGVDAVDSEGEAAKGAIIINVKDSAPSAENIAAGSTDETAGEGKTLSGTIPAQDLGRDDAEGSFSANGEFTSGGSRTNNALTSGGEPVTVAFDATTGTYTGTAGGEVIFTMTVSDNGDYNFELNGILDHADGTNPDDVINLNFGYDAVDCDGDHAQAYIVVDVKDDGPTITRLTEIPYNESSLENGSITKEGTFNFSFGEDGAGTVEASDNVVVKFAARGADETLTADGVEVVFTKTADGYVGKAGDKVIMEVSIDAATGEYSFTQYLPVDHQAPGTDGDETIWVKFGVTVTDADGDSVDGYLTFDISDDVPVAVDDTNTVSEGNTATGNVLTNDDAGVDGLGSVKSVAFNGTSVDVPATGSVSVTGQYGVLTIQADGTYSYLANKDNPDGVDTFTYVMSDNDGDLSTAELNITVTSIDDVPVVSVEGKTVDDTDLANGDNVVNGKVVVDFGNDEPGVVNPNDMFSSSEATLTSCGYPVTVTLNGDTYTGVANGEVVFTMTIANNGDYTFTQNAALDHPNTANDNEALTLDFGVVATDADGDTATAKINIRVLDDGPEIGNTTKAVDEDALANGGNLVATGAVNHDFGQDGAGEITTNGLFEAKFQRDGGNVTLSSNGSAITVTNTAGVYTGRTADGAVAFTLAIDSETGAYTYTQMQAIDHPDSTDPDDVIWLKFYVDIEDKDGDTDTGVIVIDVHDDAPEAVDDKLTVEENDTATGNVLTNDNIGADEPGEVTTVTFEGQDYDLVNGTVTVQGNGGTLTMNSDGSYEYSAVNGTASQTVHSFEISNFAQNAAIGEIKEVSGSLNETTNDFTFSFTIEGSEADGATLVLNDGPNPKGFAGELPQFYIDNSTGTPIVTAYGYNGLGGVPGTTDSAFDGSQEAGIQTPDRIATSLDANSPFSNISVITNADGSQTFTFSVDTAVINAYTPNNTAPGSVWQGVDFTDNVGAWFHPVSGLETSYNADGYLTQFDFEGRGGWDSNFTPTNTSTITADDHFSYTVVDADGDSSTADLDVCVDADPAPTGIYGENITDDTNVNANGTDMVTGDITVNYNGDDAGTTTGNGEFGTSPINQANGVLSHNGTPVEVRFDAATNTYTGFAGTLPVFTMVINSDATYKFTQLESLDHGNTASRNEQMFLQFGVTATDADGDEGTGMVQIRVRDDWSNAINDNATTDEGGTITGNVITNDVLGADETSYVTNVTVGGINYAVNPNANTPTVITTPNGELTINRTGAYTYVANDDADGVDNFVYTLTDGDGDTDTATLKVTVNNVNDVPTITTSVTGVNEVDLCDHPLVVNKTFVHDFGNDGAGAIEVNGNTAVKFKVGGQDQTLTANGVEVVISQSGNGYIGKAGNLTVFTMTLNANTGEYTYTQFAGVDHPGVDLAGTNDVIWLKLGVTITDSDGDSADAYVNIDIRDTAPEAVNDTDAVAENATTTGNVLTNDENCEDGSQVCEVVFGNQTIAVPATGSVNVNGQYGVLTIKSDGSYSYKANNNNPDGVDVFTYTMKDQDGDTSSANLSITVTNINDVPTISSSVTGVNETSLCNGPAVVTKTLVHDFGDDGAGKITSNGDTKVLFKVGGQNQTLTADGVPVVITQTAQGYVGKADGETIFNLVVNGQTGEYTYQQFASVDHPGVGATGTNDVIWLKFGVTITDSDGDSADAYIQVDIRDDAPVANDDKIFASGSASVETLDLNLSSGDVAGTQSSFTRDGITITSNNGADLVWVNHTGPGVGIAGNGTDKVYGSHERMEVSFASSVTAAAITLGDMGANNVGDSFKYEVFLSDGTSVVETVTIQGAGLVGETFKFDVDGYNADITSIDLIGGPSFLVNDVQATSFEYTASDAQGNVLLNDDHACGDDTVVTTISFEGRDYSVPANGSNRTIEGDNGKLTINAKGEYTYVSNTSPAQTVYSYNISNPAGSDAGGDIKNFSTQYNETTKDFTLTMITDAHADGVEFAVNDGPNPKNHPGELAFFYIDGTGAEPVVTVYGYNGVSVHSWKDGGDAAGNQPADKIFSSITNPELFDSIVATTNADGTKTFSVSLNVEALQNHDAQYGPDGIWEGVEFGDNLGIWAHTLSDLQTSYGNDGFLTDWSYSALGYYDTSNRTTTETVIEGQPAGDGDTFTYTIRDADGDTSTATLDICVKDFDNVIEISANGNYYGTQEGDLFLFEALGNAGAARLNNFNLGEDAVDLSNVVQGFDPLTDAINDFVFVTENNGDTLIQIDADGTPGGARENVARLDNITGESLEDLIENGNLIV